MLSVTTVSAQYAFVEIKASHAIVYSVITIVTSTFEAKSAAHCSRDRETEAKT